MINGFSVLAIVPARGGSKGLPRKNLLPFMGKPLVAWTIESAMRSSYIDHTILSSDDAEIMQIGRSLGCDIQVRPIELATDEARIIEVVHDLLERMGGGYDFVVLLQPTSPLRSTYDINSALEYCIARNSPACVSVTSLRRSPHWTFSLSHDGSMVPLLQIPLGRSRRQEMANYHELNGAIYIAKCGWIKTRDSFVSEDTVGYIMPRERSADIDTEDDFLIAQLYAARTSQ